MLNTAKHDGLKVILANSYYTLRMLDFKFIPNEENTYARDLAYAGSIEYEEFETAKELKIVENHLNYYGKFRWPSQQVAQKRALLTPIITARVPALASIIKQAFAADCGLVAFGD